MSNLTLRLSAVDAGGFPVGEVVARVQGYPSKDNATPFYREVLISASSEGTNLNLDPGRYRIQALLPSGAILQEDRTVTVGQQASVNFSIPRRRSRPEDATDGALRGPFGVSTAAFADFGMTFHSIPGELIWQWNERPDFSNSLPFAGTGLDVRPSDIGDNSPSFELQWKPAHDEYAPRLWASIQFHDRLEAVSVPQPWKLQSGSKAPIHLIFSGNPDDRNARTTVVVNDPQMDGLLAYLGRGNLGPAGTILDHLDYDGIILSAIDEKRLNPLAACAAAYVGLAVFEVNARERWDAWLPNITGFFPMIPDGAIVQARRIINRPRYPAEKDLALQALKASFHAGIPYFTAGLMLLRDSLMLFASTDDEAKRMLAVASQFASRVDPTQVFTVLQYPRSR